MNSITLIGRLTNDPESWETQGGTKVATLRLAVQRRRAEAAPSGAPSSSTSAASPAWPRSAPSTWRRAAGWPSRGGWSTTSGRRATAPAGSATTWWPRRSSSSTRSRPGSRRSPRRRTSPGRSPRAGSAPRPRSSSRGRGAGKRASRPLLPPSASAPLFAVLERRGPRHRRIASRPRKGDIRRGRPPRGRESHRRVEAIPLQGGGLLLLLLGTLPPSVPAAARRWLDLFDYSGTWRHERKKPRGPASLTARRDGERRATSGRGAR